MLDEDAITTVMTIVGLVLLTSALVTLSDGRSSLNVRSA